MRRKLPPGSFERASFERASSTRPLSAALRASRLPTAAAIAIALASIGCATRADDVQPDPAAVSAPLPVASSVQPGLNAIDPEPHALAGEPAIVAPVASTSVTSVKPITKHVPVVPSTTHRTGGVPIRVKPGHAPTF
jgi:hypothetical protein